MALAPLELFSLRRELPCCRAALSVLDGLEVVGRFRGPMAWLGRLGLGQTSAGRIAHIARNSWDRRLRESGSDAPHLGHVGGWKSGISV